MAIMLKDMSKIIIPQFLLRLLQGRYGSGDSFRGLHHHPEWQWDYLHQGSASIRLADATVRLKPREAILLPPDVSHGLTWHENSIYSSFKFHWAGAPQTKDLQPVRWAAGEVDPHLLQGLLSSAAGVDEADACESGCWLHLLLLAAWRAQGKQKSRDPASLPELVEARLVAGGFQPLSLPQMARVCHLSSAQFLRRFYRDSGTTPAKYVLRLRLARAEALLQYGDMNISQVAQTLGWPDVFSFSKAWKRHRGKSPRAWLRATQAAPVSNTPPPGRR